MAAVLQKLGGSPLEDGALSDPSTVAPTPRGPWRELRLLGDSPTAATSGSFRKGATTTTTTTPGLATAVIELKHSSRKKQPRRRKAGEKGGELAAQSSRRKHGRHDSPKRRLKFKTSGTPTTPATPTTAASGGGGGAAAAPASGGGVGAGVGSPLVKSLSFYATASGKRRTRQQSRKRSGGKQAKMVTQDDPLVMVHEASTMPAAGVGVDSGSK